ncbi:MAG: hypothetical protein HY062_15305, partial [Bacteroidetes bacterium]|nr:hypothetical protein [Bacteroidota bacterium]
MKQKLTLLLLFICSLSTLQLKSQGPLGSITPGAKLDTVFDRFGNKYGLKDIIVDTTSHFRGNALTKSAQLCSAGYFDLYFENGSGMEGFSTTETDRRNVICQVFSDISSFISSPLTANGNKVKIWVRDITMIPGYSSGVLGLASSFYNIPYNSTGSIADNEIWKTIHRGVDSYSNIASPIISTGSSTSGLFYHGLMAFNFNHTWNTNLSLQYAPSGQYDLYSVALHEVTHALGFASLINFNGGSQFGPNYVYYSRYDLFLKSNSSPVITNSGSCSLYNYQFNSALSTTVIAPGCTVTPTPTISGSSDNTSCTVAITYSGSTNVPVYTPTCYESGSSLSHFEDQCYPTGGSPYGNNLYFNMSNANGQGSTYTKRHLTPEERFALCDIGYNVTTTFGNSGNYNYFNYGGSACAGINVSGLNDGITTGGSYTFIGNLGSNISISAILSNDLNADSFECLEDLTGSSTLSASSGVSTSTITFNSSLGGVHLLRYVPFSSGSGIRGNITYVYVYVLSGSCTPSSCNLVNNGNFESTNTCGMLDGILDGSSILTTLDCWKPCIGTPDIFERGCTNGGTANSYFNIPSSWSSPASDTWNGSPNNHFAGIASLGNIHFSEAMQSNLNSPIVQNGSYTLSFRAKVANNCDFGNPPSGTNAELTFGGSPAMLVPFNANLTSLPSSITQLAQLSITNDNTWHNYVQTFTYTPSVNLNNLIVINSSGMHALNGLPTTYVYIDDVSLVPSSQYISFNLPNTALCVSDNIPDLSVYLSPTSSGGVFSGSGVGLTAGGTYSFNATTAGVGLHNISYTYTNNIGCQVVVVDDILVVHPSSISINVSTMPTEFCSGGTATLTANGASTYTWQPGNLTGATVTISPSSTTVYTITGSVCTGTAQTTKTVVVNPAPVINAVVDLPVVCPAQTVSLTASGASTYTWQPVNLQGFSVPVAPTVTTIYTVTGTNLCGVTSSNTIQVNVYTPPSLTITSTNTVICSGQSVTLTASAPTAQGYYWNTGVGSATIAVSPNATTVYTVSAWDNNYCLSSKAFTVTVIPSTFTITPTLSSICIGQSTTLTASPSSSYSWNPVGLTSNTIVVSPTVTTIYTVSRTTTLTGCSDTRTVQVTVNPTPTLSVNSPTICVGTSTYATASGADTYSWSTGATLNFTYVTPTVTTIYTVTGTSTLTGCSNTKTVMVTVNPLPSGTLTPNGSISLCGSQTITLNAISDADPNSSYGWLYNSYTSIGSSHSINVSLSGNYQVVITNTLTGCAKTYSTPVYIAPTYVCNQCLVPNGDFEYYANLSNSVSNITDAPFWNAPSWGTPDYYNTASTAVVTIPTNGYAINTPDHTGNATQGYAGIINYASYATDQREYIQTPLNCPLEPNQVYNISLWARAANNLKFITNNVGILLSTSTITGGANLFSYTPQLNFNSYIPETSWSQLTGTVTGNNESNITIGNFYNDAATTTSVINTSRPGAAYYFIDDVSITPVAPSYTVSSNCITSGSSVTLTLSGSPGYYITNGITTQTLNAASGTVAVSPTITTTYTITPKLVCNKCNVFSTITINIKPTIAVNNATICSGTSTVLTASGATTYSWSTGVTTNTISVSPASTTIYTVTGTTSGCSNTKTVSVTVNATPTVAVSNATICSGTSTVLTASGATTYSWSTGATTNTVSVSPTSTTVYTVTGTTNGCSNTKTVSVTVNATPTVAVNNATVCSGTSTVLTASGATTYSWSTGATTNTVSVSPTSTTVYTVTGI